MIVLKADKGNNVVIMDSQNYHEKLIKVLDDTAFRKIKKDLIAKLERKITKLIWATVRTPRAPGKAHW